MVNNIMVIKKRIKKIFMMISGKKTNILYQ